MLTLMIILVLAAVLLFASDRLAQARLQRPWVDPTVPSPSGVPSPQNMGGRVLRAETGFRQVAPRQLSLISNAGIDAVRQTASHL